MNEWRFPGTSGWVSFLICFCVYCVSVRGVFFLPSFLAERVLKIGGIVCRHFEEVGDF